MRVYAPTIVLALAGTVVHGYTFAFYYVYTQGVIGGTASSYSIFSTPPNCDELGSAVGMTPTNDASGGGVRCSGNGCIGNTGDIDELEFHVGDTHWTYYKDRGDGHLVDTNNNGVGLCHRPEPNDMQCVVGPIGQYTASRVLRCNTDGLVPVGLGN